MEITMKLQMIYSFYIADNECNNSIYELHYKMLNQVSYFFDKIIFIICYDGHPYDEIVNNVKHKLIDIINCNNITFIYEQNIPKYREGIIYKKYIIDKLDKYNDYLTFFAHSKGVTNKDGLNNLDNLKLWIFSLYYLNFKWFNEACKKLNTHALLKNNYFSYGALYFKDYRHNNVHNWFYSGSFQLLNTHKINKYIKENNIDITPFICEEDNRMYCCAELFMGSIFSEDHAAFHHDEQYNKQTNHYNMQGWEISYVNIKEIIEKFLKWDERNEFYDKYNKLQIFD